MFKNLRTSRKLFILCSMFVVALGVTTYSLVAEKLIAIEFAKKELVGARYLTSIRGIYDAILTRLVDDGSAAQPAAIPNELLNSLRAAQQEAGDRLQTGELEQMLMADLRGLSAGKAGSGDASALSALASARALALRVGDNSNLTLDPDLDTYYLQNIVVTGLPELLGELGELETRFPDTGDPGGTLDKERARRLVVEDLLRRGARDVQTHLAAAYRGNSDRTLDQGVQMAFDAMVAGMDTYLGDRGTSADSQSKGSASPSYGGYRTVVERGIAAWAAAQSELERLLQRRIDGLVSRLKSSLLLTGILGGLSILMAVLTHQHMLKPLERFETVARTVSESKDYTLRIDQRSGDEIGRLATAFNEMLSELAAAREREMSEQSEVARVARLTTMGAMSASIAHEINQPLGAIVANSNAALRWLGHAEPNVDEARAALKSIVSDGHRASQVIASIRAIFKKDERDKAWFSVNDLIREVLLLSRGDLRKRDIPLETVLNDRLPEVFADRVQLQQVLLNLINNAAESMAAVTDRPRRLLVKSHEHDADSVHISVADTGTGVDPKDSARIFEAFFTTKGSGMGMGLFICRSIIEAHGGRLWTSPGDPHGAVFHILLPIGKADEA